MIPDCHVLKWRPRKMTDNGQVRDIAPDDPRETPTYQLAGAAVFLGIPTSTLRSWIKGHSYTQRQGRVSSDPSSMLPTTSTACCRLRTSPKRTCCRLRATSAYRFPTCAVLLTTSKTITPSRHPLITQEFYRFGKQLFIQALEPRALHVNTTKGGQIGNCPKFLMSVLNA